MVYHLQCPLCYQHCIQVAGLAEQAEYFAPVLAVVADMAPDNFAVKGADYLSEGAYLLEELSTYMC